MKKQTQKYGKTGKRGERGSKGENKYRWKKTKAKESRSEKRGNIEVNGGRDFA